MDMKGRAYKPWTKEEMERLFNQTVVGVEQYESTGKSWRKSEEKGEAR